MIYHLEGSGCVVPEHPEDIGGWTILFSEREVIKSSD